MSIKLFGIIAFEQILVPTSMFLCLEPNRTTFSPFLPNSRIPSPVERVAGIWLSYFHVYGRLRSIIALFPLAIVPPIIPVFVTNT